MNQSDFVTKNAWLYGLQEYFVGTEYEEDYDLLFKALMHDNGYRKRDLLMKLPYMNNADTGYAKIENIIMQSFYNCILHKSIPDYDVTQKSVMNLVRHFIKDPYPQTAYRLIRSFDKGVILDFNDFYSRGQISSKKWLVEELNKIVDQSILGNIAVYGAWYNFIAHMLFDKFSVDKIYSIDVDDTVIDHISAMYNTEISSNRLVPLTLDVSTIEWVDNNIKNPQSNSILCNDIDIVINTSCEHMPDDWFHNIPTDTIVVLQTNNYFDNVQHSNCVHTLKDTTDKYNMSKILYKGTLNTTLYDRFMVIGIK